MAGEDLDEVLDALEDLVRETAAAGATNEFWHKSQTGFEEAFDVLVKHGRAAWSGKASIIFANAKYACDRKGGA